MECQAGERCHLIPPGADLSGHGIGIGELQSLSDATAGQTSPGLVRKQVLLRLKACLFQNPCWMGVPKFKVLRATTRLFSSAIKHLFVEHTSCGLRVRSSTGLTNLRAGA